MKKNHHTVKSLIDELSKHDPNMRVIVTTQGKDWSHLISKDDVKVQTDAYFPDADVVIGDDEKFFNILI